jgi:serine/threonine-protein kinase RsbW
MTAPDPSLPPSTPQGLPDRGSLLISNHHPGVDHFIDEVVRGLERHSYPKASVFAVRLSLHEALTNAFMHGHRGLPPGTPIRVEFDISDPRAQFAVEDKGPGFKPQELPDPTAEENIELAHGRGIMLIRAYMTSVSFNERGNRLEMVYHRPAPKA